MVLDHMVQRVRQMREERLERLRSVRTPRAARAYRDACLKAVQRAFSPRPRRCALKPVVAGVVERDGYRIEKTRFESRPGFWVTSSVYVPAALSGKAPAVVAPCGHSMEGKACEAYHTFCQKLVRQGFIVLIYEPCNQGERDQYALLDNRECVASCCPAHNMMGKQLELVGDYYGMWRAWDGMRAVDLLLARPDVDANRLGVTGNSGGGTMTEWLWAGDERFTMAAPSCFVTTFMRNLENELPADCEQYPPGVIGAGLEMVDLMIARAPKPALLLGQKYDFFDRRGLAEAFEELQRFYAVLGAEEDAELFIGPTTHGYSPHNQDAMVRFFCKHAGLGEPQPVEQLDTVTMADVQVTESGQVVQDGSMPIYELIDARAGDLAAKRPALTPDGLRKRLGALLHLPKRSGTPHYRVVRAAGIAGRTYARYAVETEGHIRALLKKRLVTASHSHTLDVEPEVHLYLPHISSEEDLAEEPFASSLNADGPLYALDVRGLGESMPESHGSAGFFQPYGMDYMMHGHAILLGESYLGRRVHDLLSVMDLLTANGAETVHLYGRGQGALIALFACLLHDAAGALTLKHAPLSYRGWTAAPLVLWPSANFLRGVLKWLDLPDCYRLLGDRLHMIDPWGADMTPLARDCARQRWSELGLAESALEFSIVRD
jgi:dienelactone hydrolase